MSLTKKPGGVCWSVRSGKCEPADAAPGLLAFTSVEVVRRLGCGWQQAYRLAHEALEAFKEVTRGVLHIFDRSNHSIVVVVDDAMFDPVRFWLDVNHSVGS
jgi:hypothetical protein